MRVMISQPMRGKTTEQVRSERAELVSRLEAAGHEVVDTIFPYIYPRDADPRVWMLGKAIMELSRCNAIVMMPEWSDADGCFIEHDTAKRYGIDVWYANSHATWSCHETEKVRVKMVSRRTEEEVARVEDWAAEGVSVGSRYPGMTYEQGVLDTIQWIRGDVDNAPDE